jgi:hypothetical protein
MTNKALLVQLPLKTHIDMVMLTLDNLEMKLAYLSEKQNETSVDEFQLLTRLSERLTHQKTRIEKAIAERLLRDGDVKGMVQ